MAVNSADDTNPKVTESVEATSAIQISPSEGNEQKPRKLTREEAMAEIRKIRKELDDASPAEKEEFMRKAHGKVDCCWVFIKKLLNSVI